MRGWERKRVRVLDVAPDVACLSAPAIDSDCIEVFNFNKFLLLLFLLLFLISSPINSEAKNSVKAVLGLSGKEPTSKNRKLRIGKKEKVKKGRVHQRMNGWKHGGGRGRVGKRGC